MKAQVKMVIIRDQQFTQGLDKVLIINNLPVDIKKKLYDNIINIGKASSDNSDSVELDLIKRDALMPYTSVAVILCINIMLED